MEAVPDVRVRVLGPVRVANHRGALPRKQRLILATLALRTGSVPTDALVDVLWGDDPPDHARSALQVHVSKLRRSIAGSGATVRYEGDGYTLAMDRRQLDLACFERLVADGSALVSTDAARARELLQTALDLWAGAPLDDAATDSPLRAEVARLSDTRLQALQKRIEADLATGRHTETLAELQQLTREHPLHEGFWRLLMTALYRAGRSGDSLACFERARRVLAEMLGADPGRELRELHGQILRQDPGLDLPPAPARSVTPYVDPASVAVLPFDVLGPPQDAALLAVGLHTDVLTELSRVRRLTVISRHSVREYAGTDLPLARIAADLGVASVVTGAIQTVGDRFRLTVQLVDAVAGVHRWAETYDHQLTPQDLLAVQTGLAHDIADSLSRELGPGPGHGRETASMETYRLIAEGRMQFDRKTEDGLARSIELFEQVVAADPGSLAGWVGLGQALAMTADYGYGDRAALLAAAESAVARARAIEPGAADVNVCRGLVAEGRQDAPTALDEYLAAMRLQPGHADAASWHAWVSLTVGDAGPALVSARRSVQLNPLSAEAVSNLALALLAAGEPDRALLEARRAGELSPGYTTATYYEGLALYDLCRFEESAAALAPLSVASWGALSTPWASRGPDAALALAHIAAARLDEAREVLATIDTAAHPFEAGLVRAGLGEVEEAFALFATCERVGYGPAMILHHHFRDVWGRLGADPRLRDLTLVVDRSWNVVAPPQR